MSFSGAFAQLLEIVVALALAPVLTGWVNQCRAWLQNKSAPPLLQGSQKRRIQQSVKKVSR